ncbi:MAG TPA: 50S ribosomal protein L18 [Deltaproteobacteria bacterium]|nr:50S ribosomal protein L18 [Deltaproteobacteria bacterium]HCP47697.1 50S ribosomal protein L18 [Deltaproteobacteria bacterium]
MSKMNPRRQARLTRKVRIRGKLQGSNERVRLTVFRSARHIYAQIVDDSEGKTLASASSLSFSGKTSGGNREGATEVGKSIAEAAKKAGVESVVFDRNGYRYHGRVKALADAAREGGLKF